MPLPYNNNAKGLGDLLCGRSFLIAYASFKTPANFSIIFTAAN